MEIHPKNSNFQVSFRHPCLDDGIAIHTLVAQSPPLDLNSSYLYFLQASHFAETCLVAEYNNQIVGFVSGYLRPDDNSSLFIWQLVVDKSMRGQGLAQKMLNNLASDVAQQTELTSVCCTISPSNKASQGVFYRFAEKLDLTVEVTDFLTMQHFGETDHEEEQLYTLSSKTKQPLKPTSGDNHVITRTI